MAHPLIGQSAPDFTLKASTSDMITLSSFKGQKNVVLVFYPLDFSPVCSMQIPEYSNRKDDFARNDTVVFGVNRDSIYTHKAWAAEFGIEIPLLADIKCDAAKAYGVYVEEKGHSGRAVFVIDKKGMVRDAHIENATSEFTLPVDELLKKIEQLAATV
ncbi:redoxin domain-containing protein [Deinococcus roseus]|uniref:Peroxiredoxin n=1 Tax=Deinococcus roseus TaxID=392414 RepID=A0ABQ2CYQ6_9DEIO|nr:redoxin domain-containing protein [Deinococcus roseus]GGJ33689.1 peroxiredoxin [Deinococcus roseus]